MPVSTDDYGAVIFQMGPRTRGTMTQVSAGMKNRLSIEIYGSESSAAWDQERPDELWIGPRNTGYRVVLNDPSLAAAGAPPYADMPAGHSEGYDNTLKEVFGRFYASIKAPDCRPEYPQFRDGLRQLTILQAELESHRARAWVELPPPCEDGTQC